MIIKWGIIGAILGAIGGIFYGDIALCAIAGAVFGIIIRKVLFHIFWK